MTRKHGKPFTSETGRAASLRSPWRTRPASITPNAANMREAFNAGWDINDPSTDRPIGISMMPSPPFHTIRTFLISAGWRGDQVKQIQHPNDAQAVRQAGGLVVHIEPAERPRLPGNITTAGLELIEGDFILERAINPGEYLPRLLGRLSRLD